MTLLRQLKRVFGLLKRVFGLRPKPLVVFLLPQLDDADVTALNSLTQRYPVHTLIAVDYDNNWPDKMQGLNPVMPMDILGEDAIEQLYLDISRWQAETIATLQKMNPVLAPQVWINLAPTYLMARLRVTRMTQQSAAIGHFPATYAIIGRSDRFHWYARTIHRALSEVTGATPYDLDEAQRDRDQEPVPFPDDLLEPFATLQTPEEDEAAEALYERRTRNARLKLIERLQSFAKNRPTVIVLRRGRTGTNWVHDPVTGHMVLDDNYSDFVQVRLAAQCQERDMCLLSIYLDGLPMGHLPRLDELYPDHVLELETRELGVFMVKPPRCAQFEILNAFHAAMSDPVFQKCFTFNGVYLGDILPEVFFRNSIQRVSMLLNSTGWQNLFSTLPTRAIFSGRTDWRPPAFKAATDLAIPSATTRFGIGEELLFNYVGIGVHPREPGVMPSMTFLWGEPQAELLRSRAPHYSGEVMVLGRTRNDGFVRRIPNAERENILSRLGIPATNKVIVFGASFRTRLAEEHTNTFGISLLSKASVIACFKELSGLCERLGNVSVIIKPHLSDDFETLKVLTHEHLGDNGLFAIEDENLNNIELLAISDIYVGNLSSMFSEAVISNVPCVQIWNPEVAYFYERSRAWKYASMSILATTFAEMAGETERLLTNSDYRARELARARLGVEKYFGPMDGRNAERVATTILDYAEGKHPQP